MQCQNILKMKKSILSILFITLFLTSFTAETSNPAAKGKIRENNAVASIPTATLTGKVIDLNTGEALAGVEVAIEGSKVKVHSDLDGNFKFENLQPGEYNLIASYISYNKSFIEKLEVGKSNQSLDIKLQSAN